MASTAKTDNAYFDWKVDMRLRYLPPLRDGQDAIRVLDIYSGNGYIWEEVCRRSEVPIKVLRIDQEPGKRGLYLRGDNTKFLGAMDLSYFDVIDMDAYGIPYLQLREMFRQSYRGIVHVTAIFISAGVAQDALFEELGYPATMIKKCKSLFGKQGGNFNRICEYLALKGVQRIMYRGTNQHAGGNWKYYLAFSTTTDYDLTKQGISVAVT